MIICLIFREEKLLHPFDGAPLRYFPDRPFPTSAIDEEGNTVEIAHADEVGAVLDERNKHFTIALDSFTLGNIAHDLRRANHVS